jgi:hypothetical protein
MSETVADFRLDRLESDVHGMKASLDRLEVAFARVEATLTATLPHLATKEEFAGLHAALPHLATKEELAKLPSKTFLVAGITLLIAVYALGLAGVTALPVLRALLHIGG